LSRILHVANGHVTTSLIELSSVPGRTMVWADPLTNGPVPGTVPDAELVRVRAGFLAESPDDVADIVADLAGWRAAVVDTARFDELVLWFEHDLFDQLNLIQLLSHLAGQLRTRPISLVSVGSFPGHPHFKGLGELSPPDLAALFETRRPVTDAQLQLATGAWRAFRSDTPRDLEALLGTDTSALPFLARALRRHLEEFPSDRDGLSRTERTLLAQAVDGPVDLRVAFPRMHDHEDAFYVTDTALAELARSLAASSPALIELPLGTAGERSLPKGAFTLTGAGREILAGAADRVRRCGVDRWLGGVHLAGKGRMWRWSAATGALVER
jgi:hypothetical protein